MKAVIETEADSEILKETTVDRFRTALYATAEAAGMKIISDDLCCRVLAYLYTYGGGNEAFVFNDRLRSDVFEAQKRLNLNPQDGDSTPKGELIPLLQDYIKSITGGNAHEFWFGAREYETPPEWVSDLEKRYAIKPAYRRRAAE